MNYPIEKIIVINGDRNFIDKGRKTRQNIYQLFFILITTGHRKYFTPRPENAEIKKRQTYIKIQRQYHQL